MREAQAYAKTWKRKMRGQISNEEQAKNYQNYNQKFGEVYNLINEEQEEAYDSADEAQEEAKKPEVKKKGAFGKLGDKISA